MGGAKNGVGTADTELSGTGKVAHRLNGSFSIISGLVRSPASEASRTRTGVLVVLVTLVTLVTLEGFGA